MRWGSRKQHAAAPAGAARYEQEDEAGIGGANKGKGRTFSFSPLSWLAKLTAKEKPGAAAKHAPPAPRSGAAAPAFPSCLPKRTSPSPAVVVAPGRPCSPARRSPAVAADVVPRRLSVGNDSAEAAAARRHARRRRRHCSLGGDRELQPLGHLIPFSLAGSPVRPQRPAAAAPSDADATEARPRRHGRRRSSGRRLSNGGRRSSFSISGRMPVRVRVRSPRRAELAPELESLAVVRRTRDPQRAFRESMVEMIASTGGGGAEELERLLACYLSLNSDEHHDCIVKVFRQVWFEYVNLQLAASLDAAGRRPQAHG